MKRQDSVKGFAILGAANVICKVLAFVYLPIQAMLVHDSGNGVISAGFKLYTFIYALTNAGLPVIISKFVSERVELGDYQGTRTVLRSASALMLSFGIIASLFTYFAAGFLAGWCAMPEAELMFMYISPTFIFSSIACALRGYFQGRHNMTPTAVSQIVEQMINSLMTVLLEVVFFRYARRLNRDTVAYTAAGSASATVLAAAGSALFLAFVFLILTRRQRISEYLGQKYAGPSVTSRAVFRRIFQFSIPAVFSCLAVSAIDIIDTKSCIPLLRSGGFSPERAYALFGIYSTKYQRLLTLATLFAAPLATSLMPSLAAAKARGDDKQIAGKIHESYRLNHIIVMPIVAGLSFLAKPILTVVFAAHNSGSPMIILGTWTALLMTTQTIQSGLLIALDKPSVAPATLLAGMAVKAVCNYTLIPVPAINIYGALIGNAAAWILSIALNQYFIGRILGSGTEPFRHMRIPAQAALIMGVLCLGVYSAINFLVNYAYGHYLLANDLAVLLTIPIGAFAYFRLMVQMGGIKSGDIERLPMGDKISRLFLPKKP